MEQSAQAIAAVFLFLIGASHVAAPRAWVELIVLLRGKGALGSLLVGVLSLPMGVLVVGFHNVWHGPQLLLTLYGYWQLVRCLIFFCLPNLGVRLLGGVDAARPQRYALAGLPLLGLSLILAYVILHERGIV